MSSQRRREKFELSFLINPIVLWLIVIAFINESAQRLHLIDSNFWDDSWNHLVDMFGGDDEKFIVHVTTLYSFVLYWIFGAAFFGINYIPSMQKFRHQKKKLPDFKKILQALLQVFFNITILSFTLSWILFQVGSLFGIRTDLRRVQTPLELIRDVFISHTIIQEIIVYYVHRALHLPSIYKLFHKQHHEYTSPLSILAAYAHPIEHIFSTMLPSIAGPIILQCPMSTIWVYIALVTLIGASDHSGFKLPFMKDSTIHDMHHETFLYNFAGTGWIDYLHNTLYLYKSDKKIE